MKAILISIFPGVLMVAVGFAQQTPPPNSPQAPQAQTAPSNQAQRSPKIAPGSVLPVSLIKTVDAKKVKNGDEVLAKVTQDMKNPSGEVLVPKDTKVIGHVTEVQPRNKQQKESEVAIAFDRAVMKNGSELQMPMSIQAIIGSNNANSSNASAGNPNANESGNSAPANSGGMAPSPSGGRSAGMGGAPPQSQTASLPSSPDNSSAQTGSANRPPITAKTEGVIGIPNLALTAAAPNAQGSLVTSEKENVKLESGTLMLLRVNQ
jgi:hypothetical protein